MFRPGGRKAFFAPLRGATDVPPSAAGIAGSRPGRRADFLRAQEVGGRRALKGGFKRPARATPGARYARRPLKGPRRPFGTRFEPPTAESFVRKQGAKLAPLENPPTAHVQSAAGRRLVPPHPTIRLSEGSPGTHGGKQRPFRAFARFARVRGEAAQFSASPWDMRAKLKRTCIPYGNSRYGSGDSRAEALRPRRGGWRDAEGSLAHPWTGRRRLWPKANRRRRWGSRGHGPLRLLSPISCPYKKWGRLPGRDPATPPLPERQI